MKNLFEKINKFDCNNPKHDLFSYAEKAIAYIKHITEIVHIWETKFVQNAVRVIRGFRNNYHIINNEVLKVEAKVGWLMRKNNRKDSKSPGSEFFRKGVVAVGRIEGADIEVRLTADQFSGNTVIYGQYGMGKTNLNQVIIPQLAPQGIHVDVFDVTNDYRDLILVPECKNGLVLDHETDRLNPLEPVGNPDEHLQFFWDVTSQDFRIHEETKETLFNISSQLYEEYGVDKGGEPPTLLDLRNRLEDEKSKSKTTSSIKTAIKKLDYILKTFGKMVNCRRGYSLEALDAFALVIREVSALSEDKRSWYIKLNLRRFYYKGLIGKERHTVKRVIVIDEAKAIFGKSVIGDTANFIKDTFTKSRSKGDVYIISDQFATELAPFTRAANSQFCFHHVVPNEIREISLAMAGDDQMKLEISKLGRHKAFLKLTDFPHSFPLITYKSKVPRHMDNAELSRSMKEKLDRLNYAPQKLNTKRVRLIAKNEPQEKKVAQITVVPDTKKNVLGDLARFLKFIKDYPGSKVTEIYKALKFSGRKGNSLKTQAKENRLIQEKIEPRQGKGRPSVELELTEMGKEYLNEKQ